MLSPTLEQTLHRHRQPEVEVRRRRDPIRRRDGTRHRRQNRLWSVGSSWGLSCLRDLGYRRIGLALGEKDEDATDGLHLSGWLLAHAEERNLISAEWGVTKNGRRARYYRLTGTGRAALRVEAATMVDDEERPWTRLDTNFTARLNDGSAV